MSGRVLRVLWLGCLALAFAFPATAATVIDLDPETTHPAILTVVTVDASPLYITNNSATEGEAVGQVDSLRIGEASSLNLGFDDSNAATQAMRLDVAGKVTVDGRLRIGNGADGDEYWQYSPTTYKGVALVAGDAVTIGNGGSVSLHGASDDPAAGTMEHAVLSAPSVDINGGRVVLGAYSRLEAGGEDIADTVLVRNGGRLVVGSGLPPLTADGSTDTETEWIFKGVRTAGVLHVANGGVLAAGVAGGVVDGLSGTQQIVIDNGGSLDAGSGTLLVRSMAEVAIDGNYRAGYTSGSVNRVTSESGKITFGTNARIALSRDLARYVNAVGAPDGVTIARAPEITFANGVPGQVRSGMGFYSLGVSTVTVEETVENHLNVTGVERGVKGDRTAGDRALFSDNMESVWGSGLGEGVTKNMYDLHAAAYSTITASGAAGDLNAEVLGALIDGRGGIVSGRGGVDRGLFELYGGGSQWGVANVARNAAGVFMAGLNRRVERLGAEADRLGLGGEPVESVEALGSCVVPEFRDNRAWVGGFGADDKADLEYGVSGYTYRPRGVMLGYDRDIGRVSVGVAAAYAKGDYRDRAAAANDSTIDSVSGGVYAAYHGQTGLTASAFATLSSLDNDLSDLRGGMRRTAEYTSYAWSGGGRVGYDMRLGERMLVQPTIGMEKVRAVAKKHDEYLDGVGVMRVGRVRSDSLMLPLEISFGYDLHRDVDSLLRLSGTVGYAYDFEDGAVDGGFEYMGLTGAGAMRVVDRTAGRHRFNLGTGVLYTGARFDIGARYDYTKRSKQSIHEAKGTLGVKF